ncbi:MAG: PaaI family thioesterase [Myxococcota bacterium]
MSSIVDLLGEAKKSGQFQPLIDAIPYARFLGIEAAELDGMLVSKLPYKPELIGNPALPALHGGTLGALLESTAIFELFYASQTLVLPKTITFTIDYLRSAKPVDTFAKGTITKHGRRVVTVSVRAWQEDPEKPVATANAHLLVMAPEQ